MDGMKETESPQNNFISPFSISSTPPEGGQPIRLMQKRIARNIGLSAHPASLANTAFWAWRRFSACWKIVSAWASSTSAVISFPRYAGRQ